MAKLLYRLGRFSARRAWVVIIAWVILLAAAVTGFSLGGGTLTDKITIPGTATQQVQDRLQKVLGGGNQGSGTIVLHSDEGFSPAQKSNIKSVIADTVKVDGVDSVSDPFETASERASQAEDIVEGQHQLADAKNQLADGQAQIDAAQQQLEAAVAQAKASGVYDGAQSRFDAQQDAIDAQQKTLDDNGNRLSTESRKLAQATSLLDMARDYRTVSSDNTTAIVGVTFDKPQSDVTAATKNAVQDLFDDADLGSVTVSYSTEMTAAGLHGGASEVIGLIIAAIILIIMLGTLIGAGLPLLSAIVGVGVSVLAVLSFSKLVEMNATTPILGLMLGLAVGIDYTLFIINRHRKQLMEGIDVRESIALATGTSGTAVVFAGATVVIALLALNVTGIPFLGLMGTAGAVAIVSAVLVAVTLTPALLGLAGNRIVSKRDWRRIALGGRPQKSAKPMSTRRAVITATASVLALGIVAVPALSMRLGLPDAGTDAHDSTTYKAYHQIEESFGAGQNGPLIVVADLPAGLDDGDVTTHQVAIGKKLASLNDVRAVVPVTTSDDNRVTVFQVVPYSGPNEESTVQLVHNVRDLTMDDGQVTFSVAGSASANIDISEKIADALLPYLIIVIVLSILIMIAVFRSILVPLLATGGFVLSLFAALGGVTAIYQFGWLGSVFGVESTGPVLSFLPIMLVGILFGLAMDYQLFIASGIREAFVHGSSARIAITKGLRDGRTVVTAAALIMAGVFGGFMFGDSTVVKPLGFGLAFGVLVDAFVVRMLLLPAVMHLIGANAWWVPKWLDRILPNVDVEGATLQRREQVLTIDDEASMLDTGSTPVHTR